ncbi:murein hydrolase activator EnvC family protein [Rhizobium glycinendophyticum]|uniref:Murein hydrolase activator EnvC n=1 Tax=Rhizobium glycinendophyticum TaxID=2589807 RepID=A0A504U176_9HYPH|nr:murein hydrolase activator EnvC [Rhizobium glycinendophyticum]TPP07380.1 murein hydrolase activator EnvC [Rhizobium glycinendophyticum]
MACGLAAIPVVHIAAQEAGVPSEPEASTGSVPPNVDALARTEANAPADAALELRAKRDQVSGELQNIARTMQLSTEKAAELEKSIEALSKTTQSLKTALIDSAKRRKDIEKQISEGEKNLASIGVREDAIRHSFRERRAVLAEVLAALQRMGRNPPPALLVSPEDALGSVRTAILLGAVVPGIRHETEKLATDLKELITLRDSGKQQMDALVTAMAGRQEEERRMDLLIAENDRLARTNSLQLQAERKQSETLAERASTMEALIRSLENEITSVRQASELAKAEEVKRNQMSEEQKARTREIARSEVPDKNRIAPAYPFSELQQKLELPVAGEVLRQFGDPDGTGHQAQGAVIASQPGSVVTAPADAWVVFAGNFRSYGQMIILNTGDGYHMVLSGMDRISTSQGKFVLSGEPLATMGEKRVASATGLALETDRPTLYIELRKDGKPVDSRPWWVGGDSGKAQNDS